MALSLFVPRKASRAYGPTSLSGLRHDDVRKLLNRHVHGEKTTGRLLDVGCGRGELLHSLAGAGWELHGCDWLDSLPDAGGIDYRKVDLNRVGLQEYADGGFDAVLCSDVIEHLESPALLLREISRVLAPSGTAIVSFPNSWNVLERVRFLFTANFRRFRSERVSGPWGHISFFSPEVLESLCDRAKLEIVRLCGGEGIGHMSSRGLYAPVPASLLLTYNTYAILRRKQGAA
jgi:2-polyprenyl-6-hydroxyphenyl methylase/3-demethylubiquinone-9 3-methyltransferase